jgi:SH3-like domain-containing protein
MSVAEFDNENYGGSLYLTSQVKGLIAVAQGRLIDPDRPVLAGEMLFAVPLPLRVLRNSNVREGPGTGFKVLFTLPQDAQLVALAFKDQWMRIRDDRDRVGWIFRTLVDSRPQGTQ